MIFIPLTLALTSIGFASVEVPQISVTGHCDMKVIPDRGMMAFTAEHQAKDQKDAVKKTNEQMAKLKDLIKNLKLDDLELKNSAYNVYPVREWEKDKLVDRGFRSSLTLEVTTSDIPRIGEAMKAASDAGITNVGALSTFLSLERQQKEYLNCLDVAAEDAKSKAHKLAKKLGFKVGDVLAVNETAAASPQPMPMPVRAMMMKSMETADAQPAVIEAGSQRFSTDIQVIFGIK